MTTHHTPAHQKLAKRIPVLTRRQFFGTLVLSTLSFSLIQSNGKQKIASAQPYAGLPQAKLPMQHVIIVPVQPFSLKDLEAWYPDPASQEQELQSSMTCYGDISQASLLPASAQMVSKPHQQFFNDCAMGNLSGISLLLPDQQGEVRLTQVHEAVRRSQACGSTIVVEGESSQTWLIVSPYSLSQQIR